MNSSFHEVRLGPAILHALADRALWWPAERILVVSDLHLGKAERIARRSGALMPPYEATETLGRLEALVARMAPRHTICLGDSFDDLEAAQALADDTRTRIGALMAGQRWTWIRGNHDPGPVELGGECRTELRIGGMVLRHIAARLPDDAQPRSPEISGHFHPKAGLRGLRRPCFVCDGWRLIVPAFGTYTGGLDAGHPEITRLMGPGAHVVLSGRTMAALPLAACAPRPTPSGPPRRWSRAFDG